jgi:predicted TIM-barrel fold metal-dependent hydrolase
MIEQTLRERLSIGHGQGLVIDRAPQRPERADPREIIVSADNHYPLVDDIFIDAFPARLKHRAPRIWLDEASGVYQIGENFVSAFPPTANAELHGIEAHAGARSLTARLADLDAEGVAKEIVFPQVLQLYFRHPDIELRELIYETYNAYMIEVQRASKGRVFPVAIPNFWDPAKAPASIRKIAAMGFKAILLPNMPGKQPNGEAVVYNSLDYDPVFTAIEETGITICHHIGETFMQEGINGIGCRLMHDLSPDLFRLHFGRYVFGRVLDKHPGLRIVFCEAGIAWAANAIQDAEMICNAHATMFDSRPDLRPLDYWHRNCWTSFMTDIPGMRLLDIIGADRVMWSVDYPHNEGTFGYSQDSMRVVREAVSQEQAARILGGTAIEVFGL